MNSPTKQLKQSNRLGVGGGFETGGTDQSILSLQFFGHVTSLLIQVSLNTEKKKINRDFPNNEHTEFNLLFTQRKERFPGIVFSTK